MDEKREERQKESIEEILSDLNGLLNKMPAILDGIKLPDIKPIDIPSPQMPEPVVPAAAPDIKPEPAPVPSPVPVPESEKLSEPEIAAVIPEEKHKLVPQSLGEYMFSQNVQPEPVVPAAAPDIKPEPAPVPSPVPAPESEKLPEPEIADRMAFKLRFPEGEKNPVYDLESLKEEEAAIESAFKYEPEKREEAKAAAFFESTKDFGVPDIDTLIRLSQEEVQPAKETAVSDNGPEKKAELMAAAQSVNDAPSQPEPVLETVASPAVIPAPGPQPAVPEMENIIITPRARRANEKGGIMNINEEKSGKEAPSKPADAVDNTLAGQSESVKQESPVSETGVSAVDSRIERSSPQEFTLKASELAPDEPALVIEQSSPVFNSNPPAAAAGEEDKTAGLIPPPARPGEEKPVVSEAGTVSQGGVELSVLAGKPVPDGIPPERVRTMAFAYAQTDAGLCADLLAELDSICLSSPSKPMFIKRGFVMVCTPGVSGNVYMQKVADAGAAGLICVGNVPQENIYEVENVFTSGGVFFRHFPREAFSHSSVLDLVAELMLK